MLKWLGVKCMMQSIFRSNRPVTLFVCVLQKAVLSEAVLRRLCSKFKNQTIKRMKRMKKAEDTGCSHFSGQNLRTPNKTFTAKQALAFVTDSRFEWPLVTPTTSETETPRAMCGCCPAETETFGWRMHKCQKCMHALTTAGDSQKLTLLRAMHEEHEWENIPVDRALHEALAWQFFEAPILRQVMVYLQFLSTEARKKRKDLSAKREVAKRDLCKSKRERNKAEEEAAAKVGQFVDADR